MTDIKGFFALSASGIMLIAAVATVFERSILSPYIRIVTVLLLLGAVCAWAVQVFRGSMAAPSPSAVLIGVVGGAIAGPYFTFVEHNPPVGALVAFLVPLVFCILGAVWWRMVRARRVRALS